MLNTRLKPLNNFLVRSKVIQNFFTIFAATGLEPDCPFTNPEVLPLKLSQHINKTDFYFFFFRALPTELPTSLSEARWDLNP